MSDTQAQSIIVDLNYLEATKPLKRDHLLFVNLFDQVCRNIERKVSKEKPEQSKDTATPFRNYNLCFFINGGRGMGKSTFLRTLKRHLTGQDEQSATDSSTRPIIQSLADVDPTELADGESFFIHVLSKIHEKIRKKYNNVYAYQTDILEKLTRASTCIQSMSKGLQLISNTERNLTEAVESSIFIEESVEQCASSSTLRQQFTDLMGILCELEGAKAFLITIDDADMNFNKCSEVLETVRKYMLSPHLIFVFAGDLKLYSLVVRGMQMRHFGELSLKYDNEREPHRTQLLDNLEEQYIMKLFPTDNRINLPTVADLILRQGMHVNLRAENQDTDLRSFVRGFLKDFFAKNYITSAETFIESMTTRSMLQLLQYWQNHAAALAPGAAYFGEVSLGIQLIATHALMKHQIDYNLIHGQNIQELIKAVRDYIYDLGRNMSGALLMPNVGDFSHKLVSFYLSSEVARQTQNDIEKLRYICSVFPYLQILFNFSGTKEQEKYTRNEIEKIRKVLRELSLRQWGAVCTASLSPQRSGNFRIKKFGMGCIRVMKESQKNGKPNQTNKKTGKPTREITTVKDLYRYGIRDFLNELPKEISKLPEAEQERAIYYCMALYHSFSKVTERTTEACYLSVYNLLFFVLQCIDILKQSPALNKEYPDSMQEQELTKVLIATLNPRSSIPSAAREYDKLGDEAPFLWEDDDDDKEMDITSNDCHSFFARRHDILKGIAKKIIEWWQKYGTADSASYATSFVSCWEHFRSGCINSTESALLTSADKQDFAAAGSLFADYLNAMTDALDIVFPGTDGSSNIGQILREFPLWNILINRELIPAELKKLTDMLNIGTLTYTGTTRSASSKKTEQASAPQTKGKGSAKKNTNTDAK